MCAFVLYTCIRWFCLPRNCCFNAKDIYRVLNNTFVGRKSSDLDASIHIILYCLCEICREEENYYSKNNRNDVLHIKLRWATAEDKKKTNQKEKNKKNKKNKKMMKRKK